MRKDLLKELFDNRITLSESWKNYAGETLEVLSFLDNTPEIKDFTVIKNHIMFNVDTGWYSEEFCVVAKDIINPFVDFNMGTYLIKQVDVPKEKITELLKFSEDAEELTIYEVKCSSTETARNMLHLFESLHDMSDEPELQRFTEELGPLEFIVGIDNKTYNYNFDWGDYIDKFIEYADAEKVSKLYEEFRDGNRV